MKGIAVLLILMNHSWSPILAQQTGIWSRVVDLGISLSALCRAIFAVLSGYGMYLSFCGRREREPHASVWRFSVTHILKIYAVFWLCSILVIAAVCLLKGNFQEVYKGHPLYYAVMDVMALSYLAASPKLVNAWWYVTATLIYYCLFPLFWQVVRRLKRGNYVLMAVLAAGVFAFPGMNSIPLYGFAFFFGMILAERNVLNNFLNWLEKSRVQALLKAAGTTVVLLLLCLFRQKFLVGTKMVYYLDWLIAVVLMALVGEAVCRMKWKGPGMLEVLGNYSFEMYLLHAPFLAHFGKVVCFTSNAFIVLVWILVLAFAAAYIAKTLEKILRFDRLSKWCQRSGSRAFRTVGGILAGVVVLLMVPEVIANIGIGDLKFLKKKVTMEADAWYVPLYEETPLFWDFANKTYRTGDSETVSFVNGVLYSHDPGKTQVTVSMPNGKSASCKVVVK